MVGQQLPQTNEKYYSVRCDFFYHHFTDLNTTYVTSDLIDPTVLVEIRAGSSRAHMYMGQK